MKENKVQYLLLNTSAFGIESFSLILESALLNMYQVFLFCLLAF